MSVCSLQLMRTKTAPADCARAATRLVLPTPGLPSSSTAFPSWTHEKVSRHKKMNRCNKERSSHQKDICAISDGGTERTLKVIPWRAGRSGPVSSIRWP